MNITFEHPTITDAEALVKLQILAFHDDARLYPGVEIGSPPGYDSVEAMINDLGKHYCHKIICDGQLIGGMTVFDEGRGHFHLDKIYIDPSFHNLGIGTQAMHFLDEEYSSTKWTLDTPLYAVRNHHFYEKLGYVRVGEIEADSITLVSYEKRLGSG